MRIVSVLTIPALTILLLCLPALPALAQKLQPPRNGVRQVFDPSGKFVTLAEMYKDGLRHGRSLRFDKFGLIREANYVEGKLDGFWREYEQGNLVSESFYKNGKAEGTIFVRRQDYHMHGQYLNGKRDGIWLEKRLGKWEFVKRYKEGLRDGVWERKTKDGLGDLRLTYEKGKLISSLEELKPLPFYQKVGVLAADGKDPLADLALKLLEQNVDLDYPGTPAKEVVYDLKSRYAVPMYVDSQAANMPEWMELPVTINEKAIPVFIGLHDVASEHGLIFDYRFHSFWLTTPQALATWKDTTGVSDLKPAEGSPLAKALPEPLKFNLLGSPLARSAEPLKKEHGVELDAAKAAAAEWYDGSSTFPPPDQSRQTLRDALFTILYMNHCRCREAEGKLVIEPLPIKKL